MDKGPHSFLTEKIGNFFEGLYNFILFFPYFFSVTALLGTLFSPWKGLTDTTKKRGFSFESMISTLSFNMISSGLGFAMRMTILAFFFFFQMVYILSIPFVILIFFATLPLQYFIYALSPTPEQKKQQAEAQFLKAHVLNPANEPYVKQWFDKQYDEKQKKAQWWKLENLLNTTPLARDWTLGFTPKLDNYAIDMTDPVYQSHIGHMVGRSKEIALVEQALLKSGEANVVIVGEEGVGKHTIIDSFAQNIFKGLCNPLLAYRRVLKLQMEKILSKFQDQKSREQFLDELLAEAAKSHGVILCIENIDKYISSGSADRIDLTGPIVEYGKTNKLQIIGLTSPFAYDKYIFPNEKVRNIFAKLDVKEISKPEALQILLDNNHTMEYRYKLHIPFETLQTVIEKSDFFITDIPFPEKAIQLLDTACVYVNEKLKQKVVMPDMIDAVLSEKTHTPTALTADMKTKLLGLEKELQVRVVNQDEAVHDLASSMRRAFLLLGKRRKPLTSFLFLGPTGVGKTETAKAIAATFFNSENAIMRFDMSLYQSKEDIPKLIGSADTQNPGLLSDAIREKPYGVLLLDEIEKADKNLLNVFLTILDEGYFTDGFGKRVDCKNLVIIATSNAGADYLFERMKGVQTGGPAITTNELIDYLVKKGYYTPEFLNRFDGVIAYKPISGNSMVPIARKMLQAIEAQIYELYKVKLEVSDATLEAVLQRNFDPAFGARNLDRVLRNEIEDQVAQIILAGKAAPGSTIKM